MMRSAITTPATPARQENDEHDAQEQRGGRTRERQRRENPRSVLHAQALKRNEVERDGERLDENELQQLALHRSTEKPLREPRGGDEPGTCQRRHDGELQREDRAGQPLLVRGAATVVVQAQEGGAEPAAQRRLQDRLGGQEQLQDTVVRGAQIAGKDGQQQQAHDGRRHVAGPIDGRV